MTKNVYMHMVDITLTNVLKLNLAKVRKTILNIFYFYY